MALERKMAVVSLPATMISPMFTMISWSLLVVVPQDVRYEIGAVRPHVDAAIATLADVALVLCLCTDKAWGSEERQETVERWEAPGLANEDVGAHRVHGAHDPGVKLAILKAIEGFANGQVTDDIEAEPVKAFDEFGFLPCVLMDLCHQSA